MEREKFAGQGKSLKHPSISVRVDYDITQASSFYFQYSVWNVLWIGWNTFLICFYLNVGVLDRVSIGKNVPDRHKHLARLCRQRYEKNEKCSKCFFLALNSEENFLTRKKIHFECDENGELKDRIAC